MVEAEKAARRAVRTLEQGDEKSLLAEALTTLGITLVRLRHLQQARSALERAIATAQQVGDLEGAGSAALTMIEHLGSNLSDDDLAATLAHAELLLENTQDTETIRQLATGACRAASLIYASPEFPSSFDWSRFSFDQEMARYGKHLIELALKRSEGSVTDAARLLNLSHQNLSSKIQRYKDLTKFRKPIRQRKRSTIDSRKPVNDSQTEVVKKTRSVTILLVEDNEMVAGAVRETLEVKGWTVETCSDGASALEKISGEDHYDLLLFDYDLPGMNGIELVQRARQMGHRSRTPIVMLSATPVEAAAREAGADVFLPKPQGVGSLVETITRLLSEHEQESKPT